MLKVFKNEHIASKKKTFAVINRDKFNFLTVKSSNQHKIYTFVNVLINKKLHTHL